MTTTSPPPPPPPPLDLGDLRQRFDRFTERFSERPGGPSVAAETNRAFDYWKSVQDLFTRDLTEEDLRRMVAQDAHETVRFFTREVDFEALSRRPWYERLPLAGWKVFLAVAFRLSPPRRLVFAIAVPILFATWTLYMFVAAARGWSSEPLLTAALGSATLLFVLLALELRDKLALKGDLEIARQIQFGLLPFEPIERADSSIHASMRPANTVGGDYFDVIELGEGRLAVVLGDVAGKGIPAALLMALLQGSLRTLLTAGFRGTDLMAKLNDHLHANIPANRLITLFYGEYDPAAGTLAYVNAGHNPPYVLRAAGGIERLPSTGVALGVVGGATFEAPVLALHPGDRVLLYTDGVTEAEDPDDEQYGDERLEALLRRKWFVEEKDLLQAVREQVLAFCGPVRPRDDMTLLVLRHGGLGISPAS